MEHRDEINSLREVLRYEPQSGKVFWRVQTNSRALAGSEAGHLCKTGYYQVQYLGGRYMLHRLAWALEHGAWPVGQIDHISGDPSDNRLVNLRDVTPSTNKQNSRKPHRDGATGFLGVSQRRGGKFVAQIWLDGRNIYLGSFLCPEKAHDAYVSAKRRLHTGGTL